MVRIGAFFGTAYDPRNKKHNAAFAAVVIFLMLLLIFMDGKPRETIPYPFPHTELGGQYINQFDAFKKGQLYIDIEPDSELLELENPYNSSERQKADVHFLWDYALYEGKYYSYFGVAPIFTVYFPFYAVTHQLPNNSLACLILSLWAVFFLSLCYREVILRFSEQPNIFLFLLGLVSVVVCSGIYLGARCADVYYIAVLSALGWFSAGFYFILRAARERAILRRNILLFLSAVSIVFVVLSRPSMAVACVIVIPVLVMTVVNTRINDGLRHFILSVLSFSVPILLGAVFTMWFNNARFSSPLDFGAVYQLTVNDISNNTVDISLFGSAMFSYFFNRFIFKKEYPFIDLGEKLNLPQNSRYVFSDKYIGAFSYGLPIGILFYPRLYMLLGKERKRDITMTATVITTVFAVVLIAFADFCLAGVNMRYIFDITPALSLVSSFVLLGLQKNSRGKEKILWTIISAVLFIVAIYAGIGVNRAFR